jgi:hypothetical protein
LDRALLIWREIGERWATTNTLHNLANVAREEGDLPEARRLYAESIDGWRYLDDRWGMAYWLEDLALLRWRQGAPYQALQLVSAAAVLREAIGAPRPPAYQAKLEASLAPAVQALDQAARSDAQAAGAAMSLGQAVDFALATGGP